MSQNSVYFPFLRLKVLLPLCTLPLCWDTDLSNIFLFQTREPKGLVRILTRPLGSLVYDIEGCCLAQNRMLRWSMPKNEF
jgi:hypothetical protein